jgi:antitoxin component of MazEF toxin-antitoxin module
MDLTGCRPLAILCITYGGMNMVTKVQKWGNSQGLRLARQVLEEARISVGDPVDVSTRDGVIVIAPVRRVFPRITRPGKLTGENLLAERTGK